MPLPRRPLAGLVAVALLAGVGSSAAPALGRDDVVGAPGSAGAGDAYFPLDGNGGIDVQHYAVHDAYAFGSGRISGHTRLTVLATEDLSRFNLDFLLGVRSVRVNGRPAGFSKPHPHELEVSPRAPIASGTTFEVVVHYAGRPAALGYAGERNWLADSGEVVAMNQPHMAPWWFPANDHPLDKATMDLHITVPRSQRVIANGTLVGRTVHGRKATTHWRASEPMAPYLAFFAAGRFQVRSGRHHGLPWYVAVSKAIPEPTRSRSMQLMRRTPKVVSWLEKRLGPYPFSSTGGLTTSLSPGFALENQTRPTYPVLGGEAVPTVVHELAHQWFGGSVAVRGWRDIWLNEGAATFMEVRYAEAHGGPTGRDWLAGRYDALAGSTSFWQLQIGDPGADHLFAWPVYLRGAMALQALRSRIGDPTFELLLRRWVGDHRDSNGSTEEFVALAEEVSGTDLSGFFAAWLHQQSRPARTAANGLG